MKYTVMLGIHKFAIPDGATALSFAEIAQKYFVPSEYNKKLEPLIAIKDESEGEDDEGHDI